MSPYLQMTNRLPGLRRGRPTPRRYSRQLRTAARISAGARRKRTTELARGEDAPQQRQDHARLQRIPHPAGIPPETYEYRLGNRSALEWVIDQYQVSTDKRSGIINDPNRADDPEYIVRLIGQVITVSLETMKIVNSLPPLSI